MALQSVLLKLLCFASVLLSQAESSCGPGREFSIWAPYQDTCQHKKIHGIPFIPGCYCTDKKLIWDEHQHKCVTPSKCTFMKAGEGLSSSNGFGFSFGGGGNKGSQGVKPEGGGGGKLEGIGGGGSGGDGSTGGILEILGHKGQKVLNKVETILHTGSIFGHIGMNGGSKEEWGSKGHGWGKWGRKEEQKEKGGKGIKGHGGGKGESNFEATIHKDAQNKGILKKIFSLPVMLPKTIFKVVLKVIWGVVTINLNAAKVPLTIARNVGTNAFKLVTKVLKKAADTALTVGNFNAEVVATIINKIRGVLGIVIKKVASVQIFQINTVLKVAEFARNGVSKVANTIINIQIFFLTTATQVIGNGVQILHLKQIITIVTSMPVIKQVKEVIEKAGSEGFRQISNNFIIYENFANSILNEHRDFFIPVFHKILNVVMAFTNVIQQILFNNKSAGFNVTVGNIEISLVPLISVGEEDSCQNKNLIKTTIKGDKTGKNVSEAQFDENHVDSGKITSDNKSEAGKRESGVENTGGDGETEKSEKRNDGDNNDGDGETEGSEVESDEKNTDVDSETKEPEKESDEDNNDGDGKTKESGRKSDGENKDGDGETIESVKQTDNNNNNGDDDTEEPEKENDEENTGGNGETEELEKQNDGDNNDGDDDTEESEKESDEENTGDNGEPEESEKQSDGDNSDGDGGTEKLDSKCKEQENDNIEDKRADEKCDEEDVDEDSGTHVTDKVSSKEDTSDKSGSEVSNGISSEEGLSGNGGSKVSDGINGRGDTSAKDRSEVTAEIYGGGDSTDCEEEDIGNSEDNGYGEQHTDEDSETKSFSLKAEDRSHGSTNFGPVVFGNITHNK